MSGIRFFSEGIKFKLPHPRKASQWIGDAARAERVSLAALDYIFCSDKVLLELNQRYLGRDTFTDVLAFTLSDENKPIEGEVYISIDRIKENSLKFNSSFADELHRVMIHGLLHLVGYRDKKPGDKRAMRKKEEAYLSLRPV